MKVFISGGNIGLLKDVKIKIEDTESYLKRIGHTPVTPQNCLSLASRIELLYKCDAIFMLMGWRGSSESRIEKHVADVTGKRIFFESRVEIEGKDDKIMIPIKSAIHEVTGLSFEQYAKDDRKPGERMHKCEPFGFFCRMIFSVQCKKAGIDPRRINRYIPRDYTSILHYLKKYYSEYDYNKQFKELADKVNEKLYPEIVEKVKP